MYEDDECETCGRQFSSERAAVQHMNALDHWAPRFECDSCDRQFLDERSADRHMDNYRHRKPQFECEVCTRMFYTQEAADQHMDALSHYENYCHDCQRKFQNENNLRMHMNSKIHRGQDVTCPFCKAAWTTASGLSHHLETGSCPRARNVNHNTVFKTISQRDSGRLFTNKLLTYPDSDVQNIVTNATWNGDGYECYMCHREFGTLHSLNQHVNSPAHSQKLYHCPNRSCGREFGRLAAMFNHLESESCKFVRFEKVQQHVSNFITGRQRLLGFQ